MALVITLRRKDVFKVGNTSFEVVRVNLPFFASMRREDGRVFDIGQNWVFIALGAKARLGIQHSASKATVSVAFDAPGIPILRQEYKPAGVCPTCHGSKVLHDRVPCTNPSCGPSCSCRGTGFVGVPFKCPDC